jgi:hypothetical protein
MKSHVKENIAKLVIKNSMRQIPLEDGSEQIVMSEFAKNIISSNLPEDIVTACNWKVKDGIYSCVAKFANGVNRDISGNTINECIEKINNILGRSNKDV